MFCLEGAGWRLLFFLYKAYGHIHMGISQFVQTDGYFAFSV